MKKRLSRGSIKKIVRTEQSVGDDIDPEVPMKYYEVRMPQPESTSSRKEFSNSKVRLKNNLEGLTKSPRGNFTSNTNSLNRIS